MAQQFKNYKNANRPPSWHLLAQWFDLSVKHFYRLQLGTQPVHVSATQDISLASTLDQSDMQSTIQSILKSPHLARLSSLTKDTKQAILLRLLDSRNPKSPSQKPTTQDAKSQPVLSHETIAVSEASITKGQTTYSHGTQSTRSL
jgi:hypothetical protein